MSTEIEVNNCFVIAHRPGDELYGRKRPQEVNPLLTLTLRMCAHGRRQLLAFDFLAHLLLIHIGFRQSCEGIKLSCNTKIS